jgi:guanine nucleotide-binding protein G(I)/G(S)/G(T) subunit beta-1
MADINERIAIARKEAEALKEKIKQKKDALADTTRMYMRMIDPH